jgi:multisubunit Na+/H+ antiporter MnhG subunit
MNHSQSIATFYLVVGALLIASGVLGMSRIPDMVVRKIEGESTLEELDSIGE